jgi:hypothetical protein
MHAGHQDSPTRIELPLPPAAVGGICR